MPNVPRSTQLAAKRPHLAQRFVPRGDLIQHDAQALRIDRLRDVVVRALLDGLDRRLHRALAGEQHHRDVRVVVLFQRLQEVEAAEMRHDHVAEDDGRPVLRDLLQGLPAVAGHVHDVAPALQQLLQAQPLRRIIFDNQQPLAGAFLHW